MAVSPPACSRGLGGVAKRTRSAVWGFCSSLGGLDRVFVFMGLGVSGLAALSRSPLGGLNKKGKGSRLVRGKPQVFTLTPRFLIFFVKSIKVKKCARALGLCIALASRCCD